MAEIWMQGNILKPALARSELQMVGAAALNEFASLKRYAALERRMQPVKVNEQHQEKNPLPSQRVQEIRRLPSRQKYTDAAIRLLQISTAIG